MFSKETHLLSAALISAVQENDLDHFRLLKDSGENLSGQDSDGNTLLHLAITSKNFEAFSLLSDEMIDSVDARGRTPLITALEESDCEDVALELIEKGCDVNVTDKYGNSALHYAVNRRCPAVCEALIESGADLDARNNLGKTALFLASENHLVDEVFMLLFYGSDPHIATNWNCNSVDMLALHRNEKIQDFFFNNLYNHCNSLNLSIVTYAMEFNLPAFPKLIENTDDIRYGLEDLEDFSDKITNFKSNYFKLFVAKFDHIIEEVIENFHLSVFFDLAEDPIRYIVYYTENLYSILSSDIAPKFVEKIHEKQFPAIAFVIISFRLHRERLEETTKLICALLAQGVKPNKTELTKVYYTYGYCQLFKMLLHMDIEDDESCHPKHVMLELIYSVDMSVKKFIDEPNSYNIVTLLDVFDYFALPKLKKFCLSLESKRVSERIQKLPLIPSLVELARDSARAFIVNRFETKNSRQFYTVLNRLPIAQVHKEIIAYERKLYAF